MGSISKFPGTDSAAPERSRREELELRILEEELRHQQLLNQELERNMARQEGSGGRGLFWGAIGVLLGIGLS
jgi:hypothetical protein